RHEGADNRAGEAAQGGAPRAPAGDQRHRGEQVLRPDAVAEGGQVALGEGGGLNLSFESCDAERDRGGGCADPNMLMLFVG
ncbi:hypothetical protein LCGC14_2969910, partial [marine sediment metagenome]